jgi:hypothetical protein
MEDVVNESINIMGHSVYYIPREGFNPADTIFGENAQSKFDRAYLMPMYIATINGFEGERDFFSKFGLEIRDTSNFVVSRLSFEKYVPSSLAIRPREGDIIYIPVFKRLFEIKFVEEEQIFFSLGKKVPFIYELRCELFRYNQESLDTGVAVIDSIERESAYTVEFDLVNGTGNYFKDEIVYQGANLTSSTASAQVSNWDPITTKLLVYNIKGQFTDSTVVTGSSSNTSYTLQTLDDLDDFAKYDQYDNRNIQTEADDFLDFSEINPFGKP